MKSIYVVMGQTGEYEDRRDWFVVAYENKNDADLHVAKCTEWINSFGIKKWSERFYNRIKNPYDEKMQISSNYVEWFVVEIEISNKETLNNLIKSQDNVNYSPDNVDDSEIDEQY